MKYLRVYLIMAVTAIALAATGQSRDYTLKLQVETTTGESLAGLVFQLTQTDYSVAYPEVETTLDANGECSVKVYPGNHKVRIEKSGYAVFEQSYNITEDCTKQITLTENVRNPFALTATVDHDVFSGKNNILLTWNKEAPAFFDDFEGYEPFAIAFGDWTGIDGDRLAAASLAGLYPNRGTLQYAQIINPLAVEPVWWYDYPVLRPYSGQQYAGFTRTSSGAANDDWLISPAITVGTDNVVSFMVKAGDVYKEKFQVAITTAENPTADDFEFLSAGNYETVSYEAWEKKSYDLSGYAGQTVRIAIHFISEANRGGSFLLMVDDFYVGQPDDLAKAKSRRAAQHSPANPNEQFRVFIDGEMKGTTEDYSYLFTDVEAGCHYLAVQAVYKEAVSDVSGLDCCINADDYSKLTINLTTNNGVSPDGLVVGLLDKNTSKEYKATVADSKVVVPSLPNGKYMVNVETEMYEAYDKELAVEGETTLGITLEERIIDPYNITVDQTDNGSLVDLTVKWNQDLGFADSFEDYDDFATESFGDWLSLDIDKMPVYPIALGSQDNIVSFPGSGTATAPTAIAPMVFNPYATEPAMAPSDEAAVPPTGNKMVTFFSPQMKTADDWLIAPAQTIRDNYVWRFTAKAYTSRYPETIQLCISTTDDLTGSFTVVDEIVLSESYWATYEVNLSAYAGQTVYLAFHYVSTDTFFAMVDDFYVGPSDEQSAFVGNVQKYRVWLDGEHKGDVTEPTITLSGVGKGTHKIEVQAVYVSGESAVTAYIIDAQGAVDTLVGDGVTVTGGKGEIRIDAPQGKASVYAPTGQLVVAGDVDGQTAFSVAPGLYLVNVAGKTVKVAVK